MGQIYLPNTGNSKQICDTIAYLAHSQSVESLKQLEQFIIIVDDDPQFRDFVPYLASLGLLLKGNSGLDVLSSLMLEAPHNRYRTAIIEALWRTSIGNVRSSISPSLMEIDSPFDEQEFTSEIQFAARDVLRNLIIQCRINDELFNVFMTFLSSQHLARSLTRTEKEFRSEFFDIIFEGSIKITKYVLDEFEHLISLNEREEVYQTFLAKHPSVLDLLASQIVPKKKLGAEYITDFVIQRYDDKYILVEIEKPQDNIFTKKSDFSSPFLHAYGQIIDFLQWIDTHGEYARSHLSKISSPRGLLVMGLSSNMTNPQKEKLHRFNVNSVA